MHEMRLGELNIGCFGGGTGLPSLLGGLKHNPWLSPCEACARNPYTTSERSRLPKMLRRSRSSAATASGMCMRLIV